jgi:hypothetical protein
MNWDIKMLNFNEWVAQAKDAIKARQDGLRIEDILNDEDYIKDAYKSGQSPSDYVEEVVDSMQIMLLVSRSSNVSLFFCIIMGLAALSYVTYKTFQNTVA